MCYITKLLLLCQYSLEQTFWLSIVRQNDIFYELYVANHTDLE